MRIFLSLILLIILMGSIGFEIDKSALEVQDEAFNRAMLTFGLAKGLNAVISLIQGTELSFTPVGVGLSFSVGEVLDPFNDMVERFSWIMLGATLSLGIQKLLLILGSKMFLQLLFGVSIGITILFLWVKKLQKREFLIYSLKLFLLLFILRFGAIVFVYSSNLLYLSTLEKDYNAATVVVLKTKTELQQLQEENKKVISSQKEGGFFREFSSKYDKLKASLDVSSQLKSLESSIELASRNIITLMTLFIVQTILLPLLFLWLMLISIKAIFHYKVSDKRLNLLYSN